MSAINSTHIAAAISKLEGSVKRVRRNDGSEVVVNNGVVVLEITKNGAIVVK